MSLIPFSRLSAVRVLIVNYLVVHIDSQLLIPSQRPFAERLIWIGATKYVVLISSDEEPL